MIASLLASAAATPWKRVALTLGVVLLVLLAAAAGAWKGWGLGYERADAMRGQEIEKLKADHASEREAQQRLLADAEKTARERLEKQVAEADRLAAELSKAKAAIAASARTITSRRIEHASASAPDCRLGPDFIRLCNDAAGADPAASGLPGDAPGPSGAADASPASPGAAAGVLPGDHVTLPDLAAWLRDYGAWCRNNTAQLEALISWERAR